MDPLSQQRRALVASVMKDGIYEAAVAVLVARGVGGLTMDRVAETAGVAKGSVYNYFRSKRALIQFIHKRTIEPAREALEEVMATSASAPRKLKAVLAAWFEHFAMHRGILDFLFSDPRIKGELEACKSSGRKDAAEKLAVIFEQGMAEGSFRRLDAARTAEMFLGAVIFTIERQTECAQHWPVDQSVGLLMDLFLKGLEPR